MTDYLSVAEVTAAFKRVATLGLRAAGLDTVTLAALGVWHGALPNMNEVFGPHEEDAFDLLERLSFYNVVSLDRQRQLLSQVQAHRKSSRLGGSRTFEEGFNKYLPELQPLQTRHFVPEFA